jgi:putative tryptophan/tyrosine transport system substrate-binding protein
MQRREFITLLGGAAAAWPFAASGQQSIPTVGFLATAAADAYAPMAAAFSNGLSEAGYVQGKNVTIEYRWAENRADRLPALASDLARRPVDVIVASGNIDAVLAAKAATSTIPIVFASGTDAVGLGLVASLNRPGGNITGVSFFAAALGAKRVELLSELLPANAVIAVLINPALATAQTQLEDVQAAARTLARKLLILLASTERDLDMAYASLVDVRAGGLVIGADAFFNSRRDHFVALAARHSIPTVYPWREAVVAGGLTSYGSSLTDAYRQAGLYVGRILKGEKPSDLPVQQSTKVELVINLKTAKALGLTIPPSILARADEVIE